MKIKRGVSLNGLKIEMRPVLKVAEEVWKGLGRREGVTVTSGLNGTHSAGSYHYYGYALDFRTYYFGLGEKQAAYNMLKGKLDNISPFYDIQLEKTHIHAEWDYDKARPRIP